MFFNISLVRQNINKPCNILSSFTGGTIDITVHEVQQDGHLKELYHANGGAWGGTFVDKVGVPSIFISCFLCLSRAIEKCTCYMCTIV